MEQLMALHIMGNKRRIPRKVKKALKYTFLYPRVCGRCLRYGAVYTVGRNSKWSRKAAKIRRQMALNAAIAEDIKVKQNEIVSIQTQIEFNQQVAEDNSKYISKLKDLIS